MMTHTLFIFGKKEHKCQREVSQGVQTSPLEYSVSEEGRKRQTLCATKLFSELSLCAYHSGQMPGLAKS